MTTVLIVAHRTETPHRRRIWADLEVSLASLAAHGDGLDLSIVLGWEGPGAPDLPAGADIVSVELPPLLSDWEARAWLAEHHVDDELIVLLRDGVVLTGDSLPLLFDDAARVVDIDSTFGLIGAACNEPSTDLVEVDHIDVHLTLIARQRLLALAAPVDDVVGDLVVSCDLRLDGCRHFASRSMVLAPSTPRHGTVETADLEARLRYHRPDLAEIRSGDDRAAHRPELQADRLALARGLRAAGRTVEAAGAVGDIDVDALADADVELVADLAWSLGDFSMAIDLLGQRPTFAAERAEAVDLVASGAAYGDPHAQTIG